MNAPFALIRKGDRFIEVRGIASFLFLIKNAFCKEKRAFSEFISEFKLNSEEKVHDCDR